MLFADIVGIYVDAIFPQSQERRGIRQPVNPDPGGTFSFVHLRLLAARRNMGHMPSLADGVRDGHQPGTLWSFAQNVNSKECVALFHAVWLQCSKVIFRVCYVQADILPKPSWGYRGRMSG